MKSKEHPWFNLFSLPCKPDTSIPKLNWARLHSNGVDKFFGFRIKKIENRLVAKYTPYNEWCSSSPKRKHFPNSEAWIGLKSEILQTPYSDLLDVLLCLKEENIKTIVDIGSGYCRLGLVKQVVFPKSQFIGLEIVRARKNEASRVLNSQWIEGDQSEVRLVNVLEDDYIVPHADLFFIYDFSQKEDILTLLQKIELNSVTKKRPFFLAIHGERVTSIIENKVKITNCYKTKLLKIGASNIGLYYFYSEGTSENIFDSAENYLCYSGRVEERISLVQA